jgi:eukaryotic-like serine/threonine-protein kinase
MGVSTSSASSASPGIAQRVGRYLVGREIAHGGMASVRLGQLKGPGGFCKLVALKRLHSELAVQPRYANMFAEEARLNSAISHPNVVSMLDVFEHGGELLLVMDYVHGETLAHLLRAGKKRGVAVPIPVARRVLIDALHGLHAAHVATAWDGSPLRIVHRDVSPQNIMVSVDGNAKMLDFGVAKATRSSSLTAPGHVMGKLSYMAPEQLRKLPVDARTDVFAAGVVLWEALAGRRLFAELSVEQVMSKLLSEPPPSLARERPDIEPALEQVLQTALACSPSQRFESALRFADALALTGPVASRVAVTDWVRKLASATLDRRAELRSELESGTVDMMAPGTRDEPPSSWSRWVPRLPQRPSHWGAALTAASLTLTVALACALFMSPARIPEQAELKTLREEIVLPSTASRAANGAAAPCAPANAGRPRNVSSAPAPVALMPPLQPESLRLEPTNRVTRSKRRLVPARQSRTAADVLGF